MKSYLPLYALLFCFACDSTSEQNKNISTSAETTMTLSYDSVKKRFGDCKADSSIYCTQVNFNYPVFKGGFEAEKLNDVFQNQLLTNYLKDSTSSSLNSHANDFIADYEKIKAQFEKAFGWQSSMNSEVIRNDSALIVIQTTLELYTGGAHGTYEVYFLNLDKKRSRFLTLADVFRSGYQSVLNTAVESHMGEKPGNDTSSNPYYNDNFALLNDDILFYYNAYEITPYSNGPTEVKIPYGDLKSILKEEYK